MYASEATKNILLSNKSRESYICSLCAQHSLNGRIGRILSGLEHHNHCDTILAITSCKEYGIGLSKRDGSLRNLSDGKENVSQLEEGEQEEYDNIVNRAGSCLADMKIKSDKACDKQDGILLLESSAKAGDGYGLFLLGFLYDCGVNGVEVDKERAKTLYEKSKMKEFSYSPLLLSTVGSKDRIESDDDVELFPLLLRTQLKLQIGRASCRERV